jgi:hypothetical protein
MRGNYKWKEVGETVFELRDDDELLATLSFNDSNYLWYLEFEFGFTDTMFVDDDCGNTHIQAQANQYILDSCNTKIDDYTNIKERII